jgi:hypothetical protein
MKYKILACSIIIIFLINIAAVASPVSNNSKENKTTTLDDPVPTWTVGDTWIYTFSSIIVDYSYNDLKVYMTGRVDDFKWTVTDTSGEDYIVELTGKITVDSYDINLPFASRVLHITGSIKPSLTRLSGTITFTKSDLEIKDISASITGISAAKISPLFFSIPIPFKITLDSDLSTVFPIFDFPLYGNKFWSLPSIEIVSNLNVGGLFGIFKYPITFTSSYSWTPFAFHCKPKVDVTVEAGTFNAYDIESTFFDIFEYFYAPTAGNLVKIDAILTRGQVHGELKSTTFT